MFFFCFVCSYSLHPRRQYFSPVGMGLPGLNQYYAVDKVSCSRTPHSDYASAWAVSNKQPFDPQSNALPTEPLCSAGKTMKMSLYNL